MSEGNTARLRRGDALLIMFVLLCAIGLMTGWWLRYAGKKETMALIYHHGVLVREIPLTKDAEFEVAGDYVNTVTVADGKIAVTDSDCPGGDCIHMGGISAAGRSIVCLPNKLEIRVTGEAKIDAAAG